MNSDPDVREAYYDVSPIASMNHWQSVKNANKVSAGLCALDHATNALPLSSALSGATWNAIDHVRACHPFQGSSSTFVLGGNRREATRRKSS
jgi:hypothetical protein